MNEVFAQTSKSKSRFSGESAGGAPPFLITILFFLITLSVQATEGLYDNKLCPTNTRSLYLPRHYPAREITIGYAEDWHFHQFMEKILDIALKKGIKVNFLVSQGEVKSVHKQLEAMHLKMSQDIRIIPSLSSETIWMQDYFENLFDVDENRNVVVDMPYYGRESDALPRELSNYFRYEIVEQPKLKPPTVTDNGDYGGNMVPVNDNLILIGRNMLESTIYHLASQTRQQILEINVDWLQTGHIDEVVSFIPTDPSDQCKTIMTWASPVLGRSLLMRNKDKKLDYEMFYVSGDEKEETLEDFSQCFTSKKWLNTKKCISFNKAINTYDALINSEVVFAKKIIEKQSKCKNIELIPLPVIFSPSQIQDFYGTEHDVAKAVTPNVINNIFLNGTVIFPMPHHRTFYNYINKIMTWYGIDHRFIEGDYFHSLSGGIHCASNVARYCNPVKGL